MQILATYEPLLPFFDPSLLSAKSLSLMPITPMLIPSTATTCLTYMDRLACHGGALWKVSPCIQHVQGMLERILLSAETAEHRGITEVAAEMTTFGLKALRPSVLEQQMSA